jgi:hypothetical protein
MGFTTVFLLLQVLVNCKHHEEEERKRRRGVGGGCYSHDQTLSFASKVVHRHKQTEVAVIEKEIFVTSRERQGVWDCCHKQQNI